MIFNITLNKSISKLRGKVVVKIGHLSGCSVLDFLTQNAEDFVNTYSSFGPLGNVYISQTGKN